MIIDFHTHMFAPQVLNERSRYTKTDKHFGLLYTSDSARLIDHRGLLDMAENKSVHRMVAMGFPWTSHDACRLQNDYFSQVQTDHKDTIYCFGSVPLAPDRAIDEYVSEVKRAGLSGIGEIAFYTDGLTRSNYDYLEQVFKAAMYHRLPVCLHLNEPVGHKYPGKYEPGLNRLYKLLQQCKNLTVILSHWGGGLLFYELMPEIAREFKSFYYDTAASPYLYTDKIYSIAEQIAGPDRILFGSDFPLLSIDRYKKGILTNMTEKTADKVLGLNALKILKQA